MSGPPPIWHAASEQWVKENFTEEAKRDNKLYARQNGDWYEILPTANPGPYLPLTGGTVTGQINVSGGGGYSQNTGGWFYVQAGAVEIDCPSSLLVLKSQGGIHLDGPIALGGETNLQGKLVRMATNEPGTPVVEITAGNTPNMTLGSSNHQANLRVWGHVSCSSFSGNYASPDGLDAIWVGSGVYMRGGAGNADISSKYNIRLMTPPDEWQTSILLDSPTTNIPKNSNIGTAGTSAVIIKGAMVDISCQGSNLDLSASGMVSINSRCYLSGETGLGGRLYSTAPLDNTQSLEIKGGNNPTVFLGSSNVPGYIYSYTVQAHHFMSSPVDILMGGSGFQFYSNSPVEFHPYNNYGSGREAIKILSNGGAIGIYSTGGTGPTTAINNGSARFGGSFTDISGNLTVSGDAYKPGGGMWESSSDARLKTDVEPYEDGLNKLIRLKPISFRFNDRARQHETSKRRVGLAAEEVKEVMPEMVGTRRMKLDYDTEPTDTLTIDPSELLYTLINAVKQLNERLERLEHRPR